MSNLLNITGSAPLSINYRGRLMFFETPVVMGILNVTPDSFFDGGKFNETKAITERALLMLKEGAGIIDIGGQSSKPGAQTVSVEEELKRVIPAIKSILQEIPDAIISIDTNRSEVAVRAVEAGASIVNDISAGDDDSEMLAAVASLEVPYIAMHKKGIPATMQDNPVYDDVVKEVMDYFVEKIYEFKQAGITDVILDPGFGFGKTVEHNYSLLNSLQLFQICGVPLMAGFSRKSMICKPLQVNPDKALNGTTVLNTIALQKGINILRVHDVKEAVEAVKLTGLLKS
ncbi:MAG: dihydropteroate synthase [Bacteroidia bacterium]|nr:dihydropteroate synthase [Bacteroidia bacterium]